MSESSAGSKRTRDEVESESEGDADVIEIDATPKRKRAKKSTNAEMMEELAGLHREWEAAMRDVRMASDRAASLAVRIVRLNRKLAESVGYAGGKGKKRA